MQIDGPYVEIELPDTSELLGIDLENNIGFLAHNIIVPRA